MSLGIFLMGILLFSFIGINVSQSFAEIDPLHDILFLQTGIIESTENQFQISNDMKIREFLNGNIVRVSGQTIEGFSYITYSKIVKDDITTKGKIFTSNGSVELIFDEKNMPDNDEVTKNNNISILTKYTQRVYSENFIKIDVKVFDKKVNTANDFEQNYGHISNATVKVILTNNEDQIMYSTNGLTGEKGLFETEFFIPENSKRETLTATIYANNEDSESSKMLQIFALGRVPDTDD